MKEFVPYSAELNVPRKQAASSDGLTFSGHVAADFWQQSVLLLKSVSTKRAALLSKLNIKTWRDLLYHFPRRYDDWSTLQALSAAEEEKEITAFVRCASMPNLRRKGRMSILRSSFEDAEGLLPALWFNQPYQEQKLAKGQFYLIHGKVSRNGLQLQLVNPAFVPIPLAHPPQERAKISPACLESSFVRPIYPATSGLQQAVLRGLIQQVLEAAQPYLSWDPLPAYLRQKYHLCTRDYAFSNIHFPDQLNAYQIARKRLVFEELFFLQLGLRVLRQKNHVGSDALAIRLAEEQEDIYQRAIASLPYSLTGAQNRVLREIAQDLESGFRMDRLIQGDVGSGKTVVAALALLRVVLAGQQGSLMAPTAILAKQHAASLQTILSELGHPVRLALLTGQTKAKEKRAILEGLANGEIDILIGTQALLNEKIFIPRLALVVTDEQHRFGVKQRQRPSLALTEEPGMSQPHVLVMSATPIPRTLGLILYGDLAISILDERPQGRLPVPTYTVRTGQLDRAWQLLEKQMQGGSQIYVVCPLKQENEVATTSQPLFSAEQMAEELQMRFSQFRVALLHGGMKEKEKQDTMQAFYQHEIDLLVSTTVVEVGVDNPNATVLLVMNAERFGLAQLHQLRGRVGRGQKQSYCVLHSDFEQGLARQRLETLCHHQDGYQLAEMDLKLRGPGDFFGTRQHGIPDLKLANLYEEQALLKQIAQDIDQILAQQPIELNKGGIEVATEVKDTLPLDTSLTRETLLEALYEQFGAWAHTIGL